MKRRCRLMYDGVGEFKTQKVENHERKEHTLQRPRTLEARLSLGSCGCCSLHSEIFYQISPEEINETK